MYLVKLLSYRDYSEHKLREKLREKKFPTDEGEKALNEIKEKGYLKEDLYTEARVKAFMHKGYSPDYIRQKLAQEHLSLTTEAIEKIFDEYCVRVEDQIERLVRKKMHGKTEFDYAVESKIIRYLLSKGHDFGASKKMIKSIIVESKTELE
jgi:regulatory protein